MQSAEELGISTRQVKRLLYALKKRGGKAVIHGLRRKPSVRRIDESIEQQAVRILSAPVYEGFGPTLAAEYLGKKHGIRGQQRDGAQMDDPAVSSGKRCNRYEAVSRHLN